MLRVARPVQTCAERVYAIKVDLRGPQKHFCSPCHETNATPRYCALSHCWGGANDILILICRNISDLEQNIPCHLLPRTFQDAVVITRSLRISCLWIDSLRIVQDSADDWAKEAASMGSIYENSHCTIAAAASGNAHGGCFVDCNPLAMYPCKIATREGKAVYAKRWMPVEESQLEKRAWVLQERLFSHRILSFSSSMIKWTCRKGRANEKEIEGYVLTERSSDPDRRLFDEQMRITSGWAPFALTIMEQIVL